MNRKHFFLFLVALSTLSVRTAFAAGNPSDLIINEMALEGSFEGNRYYDLLRVALRRNDPAYLADPISLRNGTVNTSLRSLLMDPKNWYLPLP